MDELMLVLYQLAAKPKPISGGGRSIKLLVGDSVSALCRTEYGRSPSELRRRSQCLVKFAMLSKEIAAKHCLVLLITNQFSDIVSSSPLRVGNDAVLHTSGRSVLPCLGFNWNNYVQTRLFMSWLPNSNAT